MINRGRFFVPGFNKLILFDLPPGGQLHCVTEVAQDVDKNRLGITGWLHARP
jgi:Rps23 Pro-64 3,4-dihydroxylase Tpa1-like proline 4-hydroxylase